jgi:hypothetical protein
MDVIEIKDKEHKFYCTLTLESFNEIKEKFRTSRGKVPKLSKPNWWYKQSDFGGFFLYQMKVDKSSVIQINSEEEWRAYFPVFKNFFPTLGEYLALKNNVAFWFGHSEKVIEDTYFVKWILLQSYGPTLYKTLADVSFKELMMMYYYGILTKIFSNAEQYASRGIMPPEEEEEEEADMFR